MKKSLIALAIASMLSASLVRASTRDAAFTYRMGAGFPGDPNRTHPVSILPGIMSTAAPVRLYGDPCVIDTATNTYRALGAADTGITKIDGILVRPYPTQQTSGGMAASIGTAVPPVGPAQIEVVSEGFIIAKCNNFATQQPTKGGAVYVWVTANSGAHVQGGFESINNGANTILLSNAKWNGPTDSAGITEIQIAAPLA